MEVHPPEHGIHTWRDFYVHMGTICLGLLIAIGLEQSVEAMHHHHELVRLRESIHADSEKNVQDAIGFNTDEVNQMRWLDLRIEQVRTALAQHTSLSAAPPVPKSNKDETSPADPSWLGAKASGVLSYRPEDEIKNNMEVSTWIAGIGPEVKDWDLAYRKRKGFEAEFCMKICAEGSFAAAVPADLRQYLSLLVEEREAIRWDNVSIHSVYGAESAILSGERDLKKIQTAEGRPMPGDQ